LFDRSAPQKSVQPAPIEPLSLGGLSFVQSESIQKVETQRGNKRAWLFGTSLIIVFVVQSCLFIRSQSFSYDEPVHIAEGLEAWRHHKFEIWNDHPPLVRMWCTLPLLSSKFQIHSDPLEAGHPISSITPNPPAMAWRSRAMNLVFGVLLACLLWDVTSRLFSPEAASFALALFVFSPPLIAHYSLVTTDGAATLLIFATAAFLVRWRQNFTLRRTFLFGLLLGLLLLAKFSTPAMFLLALLWVLLPKEDTWHKTFGRLNWRRAGALVLIAAVTVWAGYFFHVSHLTLRDGRLSATFPNRGNFEKPMPSPINLKLVVPAGEYFDGLHSVVRHNRLGMPAFFLGKVSKQGGIKSFYPVAIALKWPVTTLLLSILGLVLLTSKIVRPPDGIWIMSSFAAVYFLFAIFAHLNIGDRHILPIYPFLLIFAASVWQAARHWRAGIVVLTIVVALQGLDTLRYSPDYLSYFNFFVPRSETYKFLTDSNLDWGQGLLAVKDYEANHPSDNIWLAYFGSVDPAAYGIHAKKLEPGERVNGTVIVSATSLSGQYLVNSDAYQWVLQYPKTGMLNHSLQIFQVREPVNSRTAVTNHSQ